MSEEQPKDIEELKRELAFYRNQTKVLREKNRDLRNALLLAESKETTTKEEKEIAKESLSDIRKIITDSKKQIAEKLSQFKETIKEQKENASTSSSSPSETSQNTAPQAGGLSTTSPEVEVLARQCEYLKQEVERLENFLEQSEMVNSRLRELLTEHSIDVSEIAKAIREVSKTAVSQKTKQQVPAEGPPTSTSPKEPPAPAAPASSSSSSSSPPPASTVKAPSSVSTEKPKKELDPEVAKLFNAFRAKLGQNLSDDDIKLEILNFREQLMDLIPHSRIFYEMQMEYRRWKRGSSSLDALKAALKEWEEAIASL